MFFTTATELYRATVNVPSMMDPSAKLVVPNSPSRSLLYLRLTGDVAPQMPVGGTVLSPAQLADVAGWICAGAPPPAGSDGGTGATGPVVSSMAPVQGYVGTRVRVTGSGFSPNVTANQVAFNSVTAVVIAATPSTLDAFVPSTSTGKITVTVGGRTGTSATDFTVLSGNPIPVVSAISPCGAVGGSGALTIDVTGMNLLSSTTATFRGVAATVQFVDSSHLKVSVPASALTAAPTGNVTQLVLTNPAPGGGASDPIEFGIASAASTLSGQVQAIFTNKCGGAGCHSGNQSPNLSTGQSRAQTVDVQAASCPSKVHVKACVPTRERSFLIDKILATATNGPCAGTPMPKGQPLSAMEKQRIVDWVAQGAPP